MDIKRLAGVESEVDLRKYTLHFAKVNKAEPILLKLVKY